MNENGWSESQERASRSSSSSPLSSSHWFSRTAAPTPLRQRVPRSPAGDCQLCKVASSACILAGPAKLYAKYFMAYPIFVGPGQLKCSSAAPTTVCRTASWRIGARSGPTSSSASHDGLDSYLAMAGYVAIADSVWREPDRLSAGCVLNTEVIAGPFQSGSSLFRVEKRCLKQARSQVSGSRTRVTFLPSANDRDV